MNRKETTEFLNKLLENKLYKSGHRWAKEVVLDYGSVNVRRVDYMEFAPNRNPNVPGMPICGAVHGVSEGR